MTLLHHATTRVTVALLIATFIATPAHAWNDTGHMVVAYIAYQMLLPPIRARVDMLLKRNPEYDAWTNHVPIESTGISAFMRAATWPDLIKDDPSYNFFDGLNNGNTPPNTPQANQNVGYKDHFRHKYWHFVDYPYNLDNHHGPKPPKVNAASQIEIFRKALKNTSSSSSVEDIKSYDITWLAHIVGDIHQPLHAITRYTNLNPEGDVGGNFVRFSSAEFDNLHAYWDNLLRSDESLASIGAIAQTLAGLPVTNAANANPATWAKESFNLAKQYVYVSPISTETDPNQSFSPRPDTNYEQNARRIARIQIFLAAHRLANLLNNNLK